ncbi:MAG: zf-HC2 domain-containing protein [Acidobacteria bacterium]|nr:zf-HC2 domain-containing protein [Acidobacteriota bacterium]
MSVNEVSGKTVQICTDPEIGAKVYDYFNGALEKDQVHQFERHLVACRNCEAALVDLDRTIAILGDDQKFRSKDNFVKLDKTHSIPQPAMRPARRRKGL